MGREDGLLVSGADDQGDDGARKVLQEGDARRRGRVGRLLSKGELVLVGGGVLRTGALGSSTTLGHLDVARGSGGRVLDDVFVEALRHGGLTIREVCAVNDINLKREGGEQDVSLGLPVDLARARRGCVGVFGGVWILGLP